MHEALVAFDTLVGYADAHRLLLLLASRTLPLAVLFGLVVAPELPALLAPLSALALALTLLPLTLALCPQALDPSLPSPLALLVAWELLRGLFFALALALPLAAFAWMGRLVDLVGDLTVTPEADAPQRFARLIRFTALAAFFASGGHLLVLSAFVEQLRAHPPSSTPSLAGLGPLLFAAGELVAEALSLAVSLSLPVLLSLSLAALVFGLSSRVAAFFTPLSSASLWPLAVLGVLALALSGTLPEVPLAVRVFEQKVSAILRTLG